MLGFISLKKHHEIIGCLKSAFSEVRKQHEKERTALMQTNLELGYENQELRKQVAELSDTANELLRSIDMAVGT